MRTILIIGIGAGDPDYLTVQAIGALNRAGVLFIPDKGEEKADLRRLRTEICERYIEKPGWRTVGFEMPRRAEAGDDYLGTVDDWHARIAAGYAALVERELPDGGCGAFLVWGDPALYDSMIRIVERIAAGGMALEWQVVPGITAVQALAARHRVPLNRIGEPVLVTTGRRLAEGDMARDGDVVVMLDGGQAFARIDPTGLDIYWGAYLGTPDEILISGPLAEVRDRIAETRRRAREAKGWIMDTYLLRRRAP
ncbi:MAG TPA: precorrin-6A synthase (deacetylating) [Geminicoccaceae bacterium]|nr:precorrin-6A synthase (deacetylating) [Geminicoccus sp.]HMU48833.1 precorrin-6A synthase (deacetylating) [Geminicoccaceae bacterium]